MSYSLSDGVEIAKQYDYKVVSANYPSYKFSRIQQTSGGGFVGLTTSGNQESLFEIQTKVHNPSECILSWIRGIAAQGAGVYPWVYQDTIGEIQDLELYTRAGVYIAKINNFQNYMKVSRKLVTPLNKLVSADQKAMLYACNQVPAAGQRFDGTANSIPLFEPKYFNVGSTANAAYYEYCELRLGDIPIKILYTQKSLFYV